MSERRSRSGGMHDRNDLQAIEEVLAEAPGLDLGGEVLVGGRDHADVDLDGAVGADGPDLAFLQHAQQLHLQVGLISPTSSRKIVPPLASWNMPARAPTAPVNAPRSWPNISDSSSSAGMAPQLTGMKGVAARAQRVDGARDQLLAGAALAHDQDRRVGGARPSGRAG